VRVRVRQALLLVSTLACAATAACGARPPSASTAVVSFRPDPPVARREVRLCVRPPGGSAAGGALPVSLRAWMPGMPHPPLTAALVPDGQGAACAEVVFVMGGRWAVSWEGGGTSGTVWVVVRE
jgi:hypothetical protein